MIPLTRALAATLLAAATHAGSDAQAAAPQPSSPASSATGAAVAAGSYVTTRDGVQLYYKDWGPMPATDAIAGGECFGDSALYSQARRL